MTDVSALNGERLRITPHSPTHLDFPGLGLRDDVTAGGPLFWRSRVEDMRFVLDHLDDIETIVPGLAGRVDRTRIAAVGHSLGGHTVGMLSGMAVTDPLDGTVLDLRDDRVAAGVIMAGPGAGDDVAKAAAGRFPGLSTTDFATMTTQALVVVGDEDHNPMFSDRQDWRADAYHRSPGRNKTLLTLQGAGHMLGGVSGYDADEPPTRTPSASPPSAPSSGLTCAAPSTRTTRPGPTPQLPWPRSLPPPAASRPGTTSSTSPRREGDCSPADRLFEGVAGGSHRGERLRLRLPAQTVQTEVSPEQQRLVEHVDGRLRQQGEQDRVPVFRLAPLQRLPGQPPPDPGQEPAPLRRQHRRVHGVQCSAPVR
jgi:dienelactone hydrolase